MPGLVTAYRKRDGARVQIPEHWFGHPKLGAPYAPTPPSRPAGDTKAAKPATAKTPAAGDTEKE